MNVLHDVRLECVVDENEGVFQEPALNTACDLMPLRVYPGRSCICSMHSN